MHAQGIMHFNFKYTELGLKYLLDLSRLQITNIKVLTRSN